MYTHVNQRLTNTCIFMYHNQHYKHIYFIQFNCLGEFLNRNNSSETAMWIITFGNQIVMIPSIHKLKFTVEPFLNWIAHETNVNIDEELTLTKKRLETELSWFLSRAIPWLLNLHYVFEVLYMYWVHS